MIRNKRKKVVIQGAGFVGLAFAIAVARKKNNNKFLYDVFIVEKKNQDEKIKNLQEGKFPFVTDDKSLEKNFKNSINKNLFISSNNNYFKEADIIISCIGFNTKINKENFKKNLKNYLKSIKSIAYNIQSDKLIILQTTLPPGITKKYTYPMICKELKKRNLNYKNLKLVHSFERVMPGKKYLDSIINNWRVCGGIDDKSNKAAKLFFNSFLNTKKFPIKYFENPTYSEATKILENSYRAINISFIDEWVKFSEKINLDLYKIIQSIKVRPSHANIMYPGIGVGGYCLTKDPNFSQVAANYIFNLKKQNFTITKKAMDINNKMPFNTINKIINLFKGNLKKKKIALFGIAYKEGVSDTRESPAKKVYDQLLKFGASIDVQDPLVEYWKEKKIKVFKYIKNFQNYDILVFTTAHQEYYRYNLKKILKNKKTVIFDTINLINNNKSLKDFPSNKVFSSGVN